MLTYIGAVIGAGFASGQETLQFFAVYGVEGLVGAVVTGFLFSLLGISIILIGYKLKVTDYYNLFYQLGGRKVGWIADLVLSLFLWGSFVVMIAGCKELFNHFFAFKINLGLIITIIMVLSANFYGLEGVMKLNSVIVPTLLTIILVVIFNLIGTVTIDITEFSISLSWLTSSFLYTGYNLVLALAILLPLTTKVNKQELIIGIGSGGLMLGGLACLITVTLHLFFSTIVNSELPMLEIVARYKNGFYYFYGAALWLSMVTTASCNLYGVVVRLKELVSIKQNRLVLIVLVSTLPLINFSFSQLVTVIYPLLGKLSLGLISGIMIFYWGSLLKEEVNS
jgi:uncharacterized membrane protein YkvI